MSKHTRKHAKKESRKLDIPNHARLDVLDSIGEDLPDGAYFALAEELGVDWDDVASQQDDD